MLLTVAGLGGGWPYLRGSGLGWAVGAGVSVLVAAGLFSYLGATLAIVGGQVHDHRTTWPVRWWRQRHRENRGRDGCVSMSVSGDPSDDELLRAIAIGDRQAFEQYYRRNAPWLELRLRRRCGDAEVAADVLQESFLAVWRAAGSYRGNGQAGSWVWSIACRRLIDAHRRRLARAHAVGEPQDDLVPTPSAEETALAGTYDARLAYALRGLSPELRAVLQATVLDGLSIRETAVLLNVAEGTVKSRAARARRQLREALA